MIEIDWVQSGCASAIMMAAILAGALVGFAGGKAGARRARTFCVAVGKSALLIMAVTTIGATVIAHIEVRNEAAESPFLEWRDPKGIHGLRRRIQEEWWIEQGKPE